MYRRVNSDRFMVLTTAGIGLVMGVFTWVMYGMAQQVFTMTDVMVELNGSFQTMTYDIHGMSTNIESMSGNINTMSRDISAMNNNITVMNSSVDSMQADIGTMADSIPTMTTAVINMSSSMDRMTNDIGRATYAFTQPMSYMWGNPFQF